ncbi:hypothetical protein OG474_42265 [Kribbella sp. NBC_01505]|uniref:hypothetical protein n=1 Tax=Kribbella sp. NBC_01505 TaxID=2903580 RepID=UPI00386E01BA
MKLEDFDLAEFMQDVGRAGVSMMVRVDHERMGPGRRPWTVVLRGPQVGDRGVMRLDYRRLEECLDAVVEQLRAIPGDWEWLELYGWD